MIRAAEGYLARAGLSTLVLGEGAQPQVRCPKTVGGAAAKARVSLAMPRTFAVLSILFLGW